MAEVIKGEFGDRPPKRSGWGKYDAQEGEGSPPQPDIKRPPDSDIPEFDENSGTASGDPSSPFTGEDVEDAGEPGGKQPPPAM